MRPSKLAALAVLAVAGLASSALADGRKPGSKLYYPIVRTGGSLFTIVTVTNINRTPATPSSFGGSTNVHFEYYNVTPGDKTFSPQDCVIFDRVEFLTPADTMSVLTRCHNAVNPSGQEGHLVVTAQNPALFDTDWCFNCLVGSEITCTPSGGVYSLNAIPRSVFPFGEGGECVYEPLPQGGMFQFLALGDTARLSMTSFTPRPTDRRTLLFEVWNDNEFPLSATLTFNCWFDAPLSEISPLFTHDFLSATPNDPQELDLNCDGIGDLETGWVRYRTLSVQTVGGAPVVPVVQFLFQPFAPVLQDATHAGTIAPRAFDLFPNGVYAARIFDGGAAPGGARLVWTSPRMVVVAIEEEFI